MRIACFSGPNLQLLGKRQPEVYGKTTLDEIHQELDLRASRMGVSVDCKQSNHEGVLCDWIGNSLSEGYQGILINAGAYTHTSIALLDALLAVSLPAVEIHLSYLPSREAFRQQSFLAKACIGAVSGFGPNSYFWGFEALVHYLKEKKP